MERISKIRICKGIKLDKEYNNVLDYSESDMLSLCESSSHLVASANDYSFIRARGTISVNFTYSQCLQSNYMAFQNKDYDNKWFFAFIDDVKFITEGTTEIEYTIDAWTTWWDNWSRDNCFVVREHTNDDTIGANLIPENLDIGDVVEEIESVNASYSNTIGYWIAVMSDYKITDNSTGDVLEVDKGKQFDGISVYDNNVFGSEIFLFNIVNTTSFKDLYLFISRTASDGHPNDIKNIFVLPNLAISSVASLTQHTAYLYDNTKTFNWYTMPYDMTPQTFDSEISKLTSYTGVTIKNNKCFTYPYNYILISNNQGSSNIYKYENFSGNTCVFENQFSLSIGGSGRIVPKNYKGMLYDEDEALPLGKYPTCAWSSDAYTNWLTQNSVNIGVSVGMMAGGIMAGALTSGANAYMNTGTSALNIADKTSQIAGGTMSVSGNIGNLIGQFYQASLLPNISGGQATGDICWSMDINGFTIRQMRCKNQFIKVIDDYFTRYRL